MINSPQRQQPVGILIELGHASYKIGKAFLPLLILFFVRETNDNVIKFYILLGILSLIIIVMGILKFYNFKFHIDTDKEEFILQSGVLSKSKLIISIDKIIEVNLEQKYVHLLLGTYKVILDTAGSESQEVVIHSLSKANALALKEYIANHKQISEQNITTTTDVFAENDSVTPIQNDINSETSQTLHLSFLSLFKASLISNYGKTLGLMLVFLHFFFEHLKEFNQHILSKYIDNELLVNQISNSITFVVLSSVLFFILLNLVLGLIKYFDYKIVRNKESLLITFGLLQRFQTIVKPKRIQYFVETTSMLRRFFNVYRMDLALIGDSTNKKNKNSIEVPALSGDELIQFKEFINFKTTDNEALLTLKPNIRYWLVNSFISFFVTAIIFFYIYNLIFIIDDVEVDHTEAIWYIHAYLAIITLLIIYLYINYKRYKVKLYQDKLVVKSGVVFTSFKTLPLKNIQSVTVAYAFWQKNSNLAYVTLQTASGKIMLPISKKDEYQKIANYILYDIESKNTQWM